MYTRDIKSSTRLNRSFLKFQEAPKDSSVTSIQSVDEYLAQMKKQADLLKEKDPAKAERMTEVIAGIEKAKSTLGRSLSRLHQSMPNPTSYETGEQQAIRAFTSVGISTGKAEDYAEIFVDTIKTAQINLKELKVSVEHNDGLDFQEMKDLILDPSNFSETHDKERFLSFFRGMKKTAIRTSNFGAHQFESAINSISGDQAKLTANITRLTGKELGNDETQNKAVAKEFVMKINERADFLSRMYALYNGSPQMGGLEAVLSGKDGAMLSELFVRADFVEKLKASGAQEESIWQYIKNTGITVPLPGAELIGSYENDNDTERNAKGLRADNSQKGEALYVKSNIFGLVDQASGKETASFGKVAADIVRTLIRPVEVGVSIDRRARLVENSALVAALSWNALFDMNAGKVNETWEANVDTIISEFQKSNSLPEGFSKDSLLTSMKSHVEYFNSIKQTGEGADGNNAIILRELRQTYVDQTAFQTASRVDQGSKFDGVSAGAALLILPFVKINTSTLSVNRQAVSEKTNDVARTAAKLTSNKERDIATLGIRYEEREIEGKKIHVYTLTGPNAVLDPEKIVAEDIHITYDASKKEIYSQVPLNIRQQKIVHDDVTKGYDTQFIITRAEENKVTTKLEDMFQKSGDGRVVTFTDKLPAGVVIDVSKVENSEYNTAKKEVTFPEGVEVVMDIETDAKSGELKKIKFLPKAISTMDQAGELDRNLEKSLAGSIYVMSRESRKYPAFTNMLTHISDQEYSKALIALEGMKKSQVAQNIIIKLGGMDALLASPDRLAVVLSYTYGAINKNIEGDLSSAEYKKARAGTHEAEKRLAPSRANDANEAEFSTEVSHGRKSLSGIYGKDRAISVSVFATPSEKRDNKTFKGNHRIDKIDGSIDVTTKTLALSDDQKKAVIAEHSLAIDAGLNRVNALLPEGSKMDINEYKSILEGGEIPPKFLKLKILKKAEFFEARAMIQGNVCANKVEGMVFPVFAIENTPGNYTRENSLITPEYSQETIYHGSRSGIEGSMIGIGALKPRPTKNEPSRSTPKPGTQNPNGGPSGSTPISGVTKPGTKDLVPSPGGKDAVSGSTSAEVAVKDLVPSRGGGVGINIGTSGSTAPAAPVLTEPVRGGGAMQEAVTEVTKEALRMRQATGAAAVLNESQDIKK